MANLKKSTKSIPPSRGAKASSSVTVTVKPGAAGLSPKEVARIKAINASKADPNKNRTKSAIKAANKNVAKAKPKPRGGMRGGALGGGGLINPKTR
jgi:hypothetical protein